MRDITVAEFGNNNTKVDVVIVGRSPEWVAIQQDAPLGEDLEIIYLDLDQIDTLINALKKAKTVIKEETNG